MYDDQTIDFINKETKNKSRNKIYEQVFDKRTIDTLRKLINKKIIDGLDSIIAIGKEANVFIGFKGKDKVAVKIYRIETSSFDKMNQYIEGDFRFKNIKNNKQNLIFEWTKKEFKNLKTASENNVSVPYPIDYMTNVLIIELIGTNNAKNTVKNDNSEVIQKNIHKIYKQFVKNMHNLVYKAKLVHADLSEYNMIFFKNKLYFIDMSQSVPTSHQKAKEFYNRDIDNMVRFFNKFGIKVSNEQLKKEIKEYELGV